MFIIILNTAIPFQLNKEFHIGKRECTALLSLPRLAAISHSMPMAHVGICQYYCIYPGSLGSCASEMKSPHKSLNLHPIGRMSYSKLPPKTMFIIFKILTHFLKFIISPQTFILQCVYHFFQLLKSNNFKQTHIYVLPMECKKHTV